MLLSFKKDEIITAYSPEWSDITVGIPAVTKKRNKK